MDGIADPRVTIPFLSMPSLGALPAMATGVDFALLLRAALGMTPAAADVPAPNAAAWPIAQASLAMPIEAQQGDAEPHTVPPNAPETGGVDQVPAESGAASQPLPVALMPAWVPSVAPVPNMSVVAAPAAAMASVAVATPMPPPVHEAITTLDTMSATQTVARPMAPVVARGLPGAPPLNQTATPNAATGAETSVPFRQTVPSMRQLIAPVVAVPDAASVARIPAATDPTPIPNQLGKTAPTVRVRPGVSGFGPQTTPNAAMVATSPAPFGQVRPPVPQFAARSVAAPAITPIFAPGVIDAVPTPPDPPTAARGEAAALVVAADLLGHDMTLAAGPSAAAREPAAEPSASPILLERTADPTLAPPTPSTSTLTDAPPPSRAAAPPPIRQVAELAVAAGGADGGTLSVTLDPGELGRVEISVERQGETMQVRVLAERPETLLLLQRDARELDRMLGQLVSGNDARALSFGLSSQSGGQNFGGQDQRRRGGASRTDTVFTAEAPKARALPGLIDIAI